MKLVHRIYLASLIVFLLFFEIGMYGVIRRIYEEDRAQYVSQARQQLELTAAAMREDLEADSHQVTLGDEDILRIYSRYSYYYEKNDWYLELYHGDGLLASNTPEYEGSRKELDGLSHNPSYIVRKIRGNSWLYMAKKLEDPLGDYVLVCAEPLASLDRFWTSVRMLLAVTGSAAFAGFALILYLILGRLTAPLSRLAVAVDQMAAGKPDTRVPVRGGDEVAVLSRKFNSMSDRIQEQMDTIQKEADAKQTFIHNLAHEMRTPLTAIYGYAELMEKSVVAEEEQQEYLGYIMSEARRMESMSQNLLKLALLQGEEISFESVETEPLVHRILSTLNPVCRERNLRIETTLSLTRIRANAVLAESLITNLLQNGLRASAPGQQVELRITGKEEQPVIVVSDHGLGMSEEALAHIFEPFYRVDKARSRQMGGAGLGLALCRQIVECHHGTLQYQSEEGRGTTATACLFTTWQ